MTSTIGRRVRSATAAAAVAAGLFCMINAVNANATDPRSDAPPRGGVELMTQHTGASQVPGMDVSGYQGNVDWDAAYRAGARFAYVKATEGTTYINPYFAQQYNGSYRVGMIRGAYHFALPDRSSGTAQADYFVGHGGGWSSDGRTMPPMLDIEYNPYGSECFGLSPAGMVAWIKDFSDQIHARTSRWPMIYTTTDWWQTCTGNKGDFSSTNPLFVARYASAAGALPYKWDYYTLWQYSDSGPFPGDQDQFNGTIDRLRALAGQPPASPAAPTTPAHSPITTSRSTTKPTTSTSAPSTSARANSGAASPTRTQVPSTTTAPTAVPGLIWAGGAAATPAPATLARAGSPVTVVAAPRTAAHAAHRAPTSHPMPTTQAPPTSRTGVLAAAPARPTTPAEPTAVRNTSALAHTGVRTARPIVLGLSLILLGVCLLLIRREIAPRPGR